MKLRETPLGEHPKRSREAPVPASLGGVVLDRRERAFWQRARSVASVVPRDPYFVVDLDTGNS